MMRFLSVASAIAFLAVPFTAPAHAQDRQPYPAWVAGSPLQVEPDVPVEAPVAARPAQRPNKMANANQFVRDAKPEAGALRPMYGQRNSLNLAQPRPNPNPPIMAPPRAR